MSFTVWLIGGLVLGALACALVRRLVRIPWTRAAVLDEACRALRGGTIEQAPGRGPQARGRLGQLEVTVSLHADRKRPQQSPMWRVLAVGPVRLDTPVEIRIGHWAGWIDPWMQLGETRALPGAAGPSLEAHAEHMPPLDHPAFNALRRQGPALAPGLLHARADLMRAEVRFHPRAEDNGGLFALLHAMAEISETTTSGGLLERAAKLPRIRIGPPSTAD